MKFRIKLIQSKNEPKIYLAMLATTSKAVTAKKARLKARLALLKKLTEERDCQYLLNKYADPIDAIRDQMIVRGLRQKDLAPILGGTNRASEVLARRRPLTLPMIRKLHQQLDIPADLLIREIQLFRTLPTGVKSFEPK